MEMTYYFKPKYPISLVEKVVDCFCDYYLDLGYKGVGWHIAPMKDRDGWYEFSCFREEGGDPACETVFNPDPIRPGDMTENMFVLLVEEGVAWQREDDEDNQYYLEDVELGAVLTALSQVGTHVYCPMGDKLHIAEVTPKDAPTKGKMISILSWIMEQTAEVKPGEDVVYQWPASVPRNRQIALDFG